MPMAQGIPRFAKVVLLLLVVLAVFGGGWLV